jgi:putative hydrolase of the HAD superfamily
MFRAVIFDLGGVVFPSPFEAFDLHSAAVGLEPAAVRALIRTSSETGAWEALERGELTMAEFVTELDAESAAAGFHLDAVRLMRTIAEHSGARPQMVDAIERIRASGLKTAALTNNWINNDGSSTPGGARSAVEFDVVIQSAVEGLRKPDPRIYELTLARLEVTAAEAVFLDDLGINLKPAREIGITTIKVADPDVALAELSALLGIDVAA